MTMKSYTVYYIVKANRQEYARCRHSWKRPWSL